MIGTDEPASGVGPPAAGRRTRVLSVFAVLLIAAGFRLANFPHRYEVRDMDETGYLAGGLVLWEGITPGIRVAPAAPQTWVTWLYAASRSAVAMARPDPVTRAVALPARPFVVVDRVLFDAYQDLSGLRRLMLAVTVVVAVVGTYGAFRLGDAYGGPWGGVLAGGLVATLPLYVEFAGMSRPYSDAWLLSFAALGTAAAARGRRRWAQTGLFLALSIGSRVDMLAVVPLVAWVFWDRPEPGRNWRPAAKAVALAAVLVLLMTPWFTMSPTGILRTIATTRLTALAAPAGNPRLATVRDLAWGQGLGPAVLASGLFLLPTLAGGRWGRRWALAIVVGLLVLSMLLGPYVPLRYHGGPIAALLVLTAVGGGEAIRRWRGAGWAVPTAVGVALLLPLVQATVQVVHRRSAWAPEAATAWVEQHVPAGTCVYDQVVWDLRPPLPTPAAADAAWDEVTDQQAWRRKFDRGLSRFGVATADLPRALSEDNLVLDRGLWRRYFILGSRGGQPGRPRFDLRPFGTGSQVFGPQDLPQRFARGASGVVVWREPVPPPSELGPAVARWTNAAGLGTFVFCSPDVRAKLKG